MRLEGFAIGGLGWPHDLFLAAALGGDALGELDLDALERGRRALPRGQCAPLLFTTGALLRAAERAPRSCFLAVGSCGPCRFSLFENAWRRALSSAGHHGFSVIGVEQSLPALTRALGADGVERMISAIAAADALQEMLRRILPHAVDPDALVAAARALVLRVAARIAAGASPIAALRVEPRWHAHLPLRPPAALGRAVLIGEPWSAHVSGAPQLDLPRLLAPLGVEVEAMPWLTWLAYRVWEMREAPFGSALEPSRAELELADAVEALAAWRLGDAAAALGLTGFELPSIDDLAARAEPYLSRGVRGGYGHVEVGLAVRAREERRGHVVLSVKSQGCVPSSGVSDAIVPAALRGALPFLSLEVSEDGAAARESRLMLRAAAAREAAEAEVRHASRGRASARPVAFDPLAAPRARGSRPFASTLACAIQEEVL